MSVPVYRTKNTLGTVQAAGGHVQAPSREQFDRGGKDIAQMGQNLASALEPWKEGEDEQRRRLNAAEERLAKRQQVKRQTDILLGFQRDNDTLLNGSLDENGNTVEEGLLQKQQDNAATVAKDYLEKGQAVMDKYLSKAQTPDEYEELRRSLSKTFASSYNRVVLHQLQEERKSADNATKAFFDNAVGRAGAITNPADMREHLDELYRLSNQHSEGKGLTAEEAKSARYELANKNMTASVKGAVLSGNLGAARSMLDQLKNDMLPADWNALNFYVTKAQEAGEQAKTGENVDADEILYQRAIVQMSQDPAAFQQEVKAAGNNMYAFQQKFMKDTGLTLPAKDLKTYLDWAQKALDDPAGTIGQQKAVNFAAAKTEYDSFEIGKAEEDYPVGNKEFDSPAALADAAGRLRTQILSGAFTDNDAKTAQTQLNNYRRALGAKIKKSAPNTWFGQTGDEFLQKSIHKFVSAPGTEDFPLEDIAGIYEEAVRLAGKEQLDLTADYDEQPKAFNQLVDQAKKNFVAAKYGVPVETVEMALVNGRVLALQNFDNPTKADFAKSMESYIAGYKRSQHGANVKTQNGKILNMYFDED